MQTWRLDIFFCLLAQRSADSETERDEADIDFDLIARALRQFEDTRRSSENSASNQQEAEDGETLIQQAMKVGLK